MVGGEGVHFCLACPDLSHTQGRLFTYDDTHRHRLGPNFHQIPVNCPYATRARNYQRDGPMTIDGNQGPAAWGMSAFQFIPHSQYSLKIVSLFFALTSHGVFPSQEELPITFLTVLVVHWTTLVLAFPRLWWLVACWQSVDSCFKNEAMHSFFHFADHGRCSSL